MRRSKSYQNVIAFAAVAAVCLMAGCAAEETRKNDEPQALVYEGMAKGALEQVLGRPDSIAAPQEVYDAERKRKIILERWYYPRRTVVLLDDTVKVDNELRSADQFK